MTALIFAKLRQRASSGGGTSSTLFWSDPATWGGSIPADGDDVTIGAGVTVVLDTTTAILGVLTISGTLDVSTSVDTHLRATTIMGAATGKYTSGTLASANLRLHTRTMYGSAPAAANPGLSHSGDTPTANYPGDSVTVSGWGTVAGAKRGFIMMDGFQYKMYGYVPSVISTRVNLSATGGSSVLTAGTTVIPLATGVTWQAGDEIIITPTGFYDVTKRTEKFTVVADTNGAASVTITPGLGYSRWAKLQYLNDANTITVDASTGFTTLRATANIPATIDQRARVLHVSRRHKVQGFNDSEITNKRFGSHDMVMGINCKIFLSGVRWDNAGQGGLQGRYPFHFHMPSYNISTGAVLGSYADGDAALENCTFTTSFNRLFTYHGCRGVRVSRAIGWNFFGHGYFFEDASEMDNTLEDSYAYLSKDPGDGAGFSYAPRGFRIKRHDGTQDDQSGATGLWVSNMRNHIRRNVCGDTIGPAIWNSISQHGTTGATSACWGPSKLVAGIYPESIAPLDWDNNEGHCSRVHGRDGFFMQNDEEGHTTSLGKLTPTVGGVPGAATVDWVQTNDFYWKNGIGGATTSSYFGGYHHTVWRPVLTGFRFVDNYGFDIHGTTQQGYASEATFVEKTLNHESINYGIRNGAVSYHGTFAFRDITAIGYAPTTPAPLSRDDRTHLWMKCFFGGFDNYTEPFFAYSKGFTNWRIGAGFAMFPTPGPNIQNLSPFSTFSGGSMANGSPWASMSTAFYDHWGTFFGAGAGVTAIPNISFFTNGLTTTSLAPGGVTTGWVTTATQHFGFQAYDENLFQVIDTSGIDISRAQATFQKCDPTTLADIGGLTYDTGTPNAQSGGFPGHTVVMPVGGAVRYTLPSANPISTARYKIDKALNNTSDYFYLGFPWPNAAPLTRIEVVPAYYGDPGTAIANAGSKANLLAATSIKYWRDTTNNVLWLKAYQPSGAYQRASIGSATDTENYTFTIILVR